MAFLGCQNESACLKNEAIAKLSRIVCFAELSAKSNLKRVTCSMEAVVISLLSLENQIFTVAMNIWRVLLVNYLLRSYRSTYCRSCVPCTGPIFCMTFLYIYHAPGGSQCEEQGVESVDFKTMLAQLCRAKEVG